MGHDERLALIAKGKPDFAPGTQFRYSNSGYHLLGLILEKVTGKPYGEALRDRITAKVGLTDTYLATGAIDVTKNEALTYIRIGTDWKPVPETHPSILFSGGGVVSTPGDLAKFARALFDGKVVTKESLDRMRTIRDGDEMGMGMEKYTFAGKTFYGHAGGGDNYGAWLAYLPEEKLAVAYATNAKVYPVPDLVRGVVDIYSGKPFTIPTLESLAVRPEVLDQYVGVYANPDATAKATITRDGATLFFKPPGTDSAVPLEATAENKFQIEGVAVIEFEKGRMTVKRRGGERVFTKENVPRSALDLLDIDGRHPLVPLPDAVVALPHDRWRVVLQGAECRRHGRPRGGVPPAAGVARVHGLVPASACSPNQVLHLTRPASALPGLHSLPVRAGQVTTVAAIRWCCSTARS